MSSVTLEMHVNFSASKFNKELANINWRNIIANDKDIDNIFITLNKVTKFLNKHAFFISLSKRKREQL